MAARRPFREHVRAVLREPLTHFLLFGLLIFAVAQWLEARSHRYVITVSPADVTRIANSYEQQYGSPPQPAQMRTMIDGYIREEVFLREGLALGLDANDEIVRRRVAQKFQFLQADMATPREPTDAELRAWFASHAAQFVVPERRSFDQRYYAIDRRGDGAARALAGYAAAKLSRGVAAPPGDPFPGPANVTRLAKDEVARLFGGDGFAPEVFAAPTGRWIGPVRSGYGWHALRVTQVAPARPRSFAEAKDDARRAWQDQDRAAQNDAAYRALLARYTVDHGGRP